MTTVENHKFSRNPNSKISNSIEHINNSHNYMTNQVQFNLTGKEEDFDWPNYKVIVRLKQVTFNS